MNPSFEEFEQAQKTIKDCSTGKYKLKKSEYRTAKYWYGCSSDYYHPLNPKDFRSPLNEYGSQTAQNGNSYMGIMLYRPDEPLAREYLCGKLINALIKDSLYRLSFYLSLEDGRTLSVSNVGAFLSGDSLQCFENFADQVKPLSLTFNYYPQIENDTQRILKDKKNWMKIEGDYVAKENEKYIIIGNFDFGADILSIKSINDSTAFFQKAITVNDIPTTEKFKSKYPIYSQKVDAIPGFMTADNAYYYIDDICLAPIINGKCNCEQIITLPSRFSQSSAIVGDTSK